MAPFHQPLYQIILRFHWLVIALIAVVEVCRILIYKWPPAAPLISLGLLAILIPSGACLAKINAPVPRFVIACAEVIIMTTAACFGVSRVFPCLLLTSLARYSMLFNVQPLAALIALMGIPLTQLLFLWLRHLALSSVGAPDDRFLFDPIAGAAAGLMYLAGLILLVIAIRYLNIEQDSRKQAQRLMLEIKDMTTELERSRLAREIHDSLGHSLTALNMQLEVFSQLHKTDPQQAMEAFTTARRLATDILNDVRAVVHSVRHQDFRFEESLQSMVEQSRRLKDTDIQLKLEAHNIPQASAYQLYNIARECVTNSLKHASAREISVSVKEDDEYIQLECTDDGTGFDAGQNSSKGYGLRGVKERAESLGGTLTVESAVGRGTQILVRVPKVQQVNDSHSNS